VQPSGFKLDNIESALFNEEIKKMQRLCIVNGATHETIRRYGP
jgi:hypothetical protein